MLVASWEYCALFPRIQCVDELIHHPIPRLIGVPCVQPQLSLTVLLPELSAKLGLPLSGRVARLWADLDVGHLLVLLAEEINLDMIFLESLLVHLSFLRFSLRCTSLRALLIVGY